VAPEADLALREGFDVVEAASWDFFVSCAPADRAWGEWTAWQLESVGYRVLVPAWDFVAGSNRVGRMQDGMVNARHTIALLSANYARSEDGNAQWWAVHAVDPTGSGRALLPVRIEDWQPSGLLAAVVSIDLFGVSAQTARRRLLDGVADAARGRAKPSREPAFPSPSAEPEFPGVADPSGLAAVAPLAALLSRCVVRVLSDGRPRGSGFFVTPTEIVTWAGLLDGGRITVAGRDDCCSPALLMGETSEVALLRLIDPPDGQPCVALDPAPPERNPADILRVAAWIPDDFTPDAVVLVGATVECDGDLFDRDRFLPLDDGRVAQQLAGAPLLNTRTGAVCGLVGVARNGTDAEGCYGVALDCLVNADAGPSERNRDYHTADSRWRRAVAEEGRLRGERLAGWATLPLMRPLVTARRDVEGSRADLLHPRRGVVPFLGRADLLTQLMWWREDSEPLRVLVLSGAGGFGKTRTAVEMTLAAERAGWTAGFLAVLDGGGEDTLAVLAACPDRLLVAVDYAETRPSVVARLLFNLHRRPPTRPARVVLIIRQAETKAELRELFATGDAKLELAGLIDAADLIRLDQDVEELDRRELFDVATRVFADALHRPSRVTSVPSLRAAHFSRPLYVLAAALLASEGTRFDGGTPSNGDTESEIDGLTADDLLTTLLDRHEAEYWDRWSQRLGLGLSRADQRRAVAWAALLGAETESEALALVRELPGLEDCSGERRRAVAVWLSHLYGSGRLDLRPAIAPLEPDLLAEALIDRELVTDGSD